MSVDTKCANCDDAVSLLKVVAALITSNAQITTELASLHAALARLAIAQSAPPTVEATVNVVGKEAIMTVSDGSGAGSPEVYQEICKGNWHGRLGRTHMVDVDRMPDSRRMELDTYLHRTINSMFPIGSSYAGIDADAIFLALSAFGLRMEDRGLLADSSSGLNPEQPTVARLRSTTNYYYGSGKGKFGDYWKAFATETLTELACYRGLFTAEGLLEDVK